MRHKVRFHYDNQAELADPYLKIWKQGTGRMRVEVGPAGTDDYGYYYDVDINRRRFNFTFADQETDREDGLNRFYQAGMGGEIWCKADIHNIYPVQPAEPIGTINEVYAEIAPLLPENNLYMPQTDVSEGTTYSLLGAHKLADGSVSFGFFHPRAGRVYLGFNLDSFQAPKPCLDCEQGKNEQFIELDLYEGYYGEPNIWWTRIPAEVVEKAQEPLEYKYYVQGGTEGVERWVYDPYTRVYSSDYELTNCQVVDPTQFDWTDEDWETPDMRDLIIYELNVYGFTDGDSEIPLEDQSTFQGIIQRIEEGYFADLGVTALALMPTSEAWSDFGLGYDPCSFMSVEQDFGTPDEFRELVNTAHEHGLAVIIDQVFNHTSNQFNPLWGLIDDGSDPGGLYFSGTTQWGNRLATEVEEVENMLIDSCKLFIEEYHVDGFRFDATHSYFMDHRLLHELQAEIKKDYKPDTVLIAENLPNEPDLNFNGYDGYAQWSDKFHDKLKALLREGNYRDRADDSPAGLGDIFYFGKSEFAAHTNNAVNYSESHDEPSIKYELETNNLLDCDLKERKAKLGLFSCLVALGQPMIYMGQEFGINREENVIDVDLATPDPNCPEAEADSFYYWTRGIITLRREEEALKVAGYNPVESGNFEWKVGPWMSEKRGQNQRVIGWKTKAETSGEEIMVLINFEGAEVEVEPEVSTSIVWRKLADIEQVYQPPEELTAKQLQAIKLPPYSGFLYKKEE